MERNLRIDYKEFTNCLRIAIVPDDLQDERLEDVRTYCKKYGFTNVMLFFNAEEYNLGHITKEEAMPWIEMIKKAKRVLEANGISVSYIAKTVSNSRNIKHRLSERGLSTSTVSEEYNVTNTFGINLFHFRILLWHLP